MRPLGVLLSIVIVVGAVFGTVWLARYAPWVTPTPPRPQMTWEKAIKPPPPTPEELKKQEEAAAKQEAKKAPSKAEEPKVEDPPPIAAKGPYPKAIVGERTFGFDRMAVDEEKKHKFRIENKGQAPLVLAKGPTNCKCTISNISNKEIPPGGFAEIEMSWTPREPQRDFEKTATIYTNDPEEKEIKFHVVGKVVQQFIVNPEHTWSAGSVTDVQEGLASGRIASEIDRNFDILSVDSPHPLVKATWKPVPPKEVAREGWLAAYDFKVVVDKGIPIGPFRTRLRIHTNLEGEKTIDIEVKASRTGPILFLPPRPLSPPGGAVFWSLEKSTLNMGRVSQSKGRKVALPALIYGMKDKFQLTGVDAKDKFIKVTLEADPELAGSAEQQGYRIVFEIPPGSPAVTRISPDDSRVTLKTNHPKLSELNFNLEFVAQQ